MIWKPKERKLTEEEAVELAREQLAPYWFNSKPLIAGVQNEGKLGAHPLDKKFRDCGWVLLFIDPTTIAGELAMVRMVEWFKRYGDQGIGFTAVLKFPYPELFSRPSIEEACLKYFKVNFPVMVDADGLLSAAFGAKGEPKAVLVYQNAMLFTGGGVEWQMGLEEEIQKLLRKKDPGLPMFQPISTPWSGRDVSRIEFGSGKSDLKPVLSIPEVLDNDEIIFTGKWERDQNKITTEDKKASIAFKAHSPNVYLIAKAFNKTVEPGIVVVEVNGVVVFEQYVAPDLATDEEGRTVVKLNKPWFYRILKDLPEHERSITFRFPTAEHLKIALYAVQFGE